MPFKFSSYFPVPFLPTSLPLSSVRPFSRAFLSAERSYCGGQQMAMTLCSPRRRSGQRGERGRGDCAARARAILVGRALGGGAEAACEETVTGERDGRARAERESVTGERWSRFFGAALRARAQSPVSIASLSIVFRNSDSVYLCFACFRLMLTVKYVY